MQKPNTVPTLGFVEIWMILIGTCHQYLQGKSMGRHTECIARLPIPCVQSVVSVCTSYQLQ
eukprot:4782847-Ditylum_brightwellii.AAC.1